MKDKLVYLQDMLDAVAKIESYLSGVDQDMFYDNTEKQDAVIRQFEIIGEAANSLRKVMPADDGLPWTPMISMRNKLIHEYHGVDLETVWETARRDLPDLKEKLKMMLG